jgi:hypothetical protein
VLCRSLKSEDVVVRMKSKAKEGAKVPLSP